MISEDRKAIENALVVAEIWGTVEAPEHKAWVIDQMVRMLTGDRYDDWVRFGTPLRLESKECEPWVVGEYPGSDVECKEPECCGGDFQ